ncbi:hypothetical protein [Anaerovibrio sp. RM50]|uniref:hypothetical protein n=1 Tax=Anaerovibrio sp. RM50 TaxID=1200557 RepID=UPI0012EC06EA|nr:hypothetical protein [Anaerovibrio sp. RM50]
MNFEDYYSLGEQIHSCLLDVRGMKDEVKQLNTVLDDIKQKLNSTADLRAMGKHNM